MATSASKFYYHFVNGYGCKHHRTNPEDSLVGLARHPRMVAYIYGNGVIRLYIGPHTYTFRMGQSILYQSLPINIPLCLHRPDAPRPDVEKTEIAYVRAFRSPTPLRAATGHHVAAGKC